MENLSFFAVLLENVVAKEGRSLRARIFVASGVILTPFAAYSTALSFPQHGESRATFGAEGVGNGNFAVSGSALYRFYAQYVPIGVCVPQFPLRESGGSA